MYSRFNCSSQNYSRINSYGATAERNGPKCFPFRTFPNTSDYLPLSRRCCIVLRFPYPFRLYFVPTCCLHLLTQYLFLTYPERKMLRARPKYRRDDISNMNLNYSGKMWSELHPGEWAVEVSFGHSNELLHSIKGSKFFKPVQQPLASRRATLLQGVTKLVISGNYNSWRFRLIWGFVGVKTAFVCSMLLEYYVGDPTVRRMSRSSTLSGHSRKVSADRP
jgi:hypothetical protein